MEDGYEQPAIESGVPVHGGECDFEVEIMISDEEVEYIVTAEKLNQASVSSGSALFQNEGAPGEPTLLNEGVEVYLTWGAVKLFRARFISCSAGTSGGSLQIEGSFLILRVIQAAAVNWKHSDEDIHRPNAIIKWKYKYVQKIVNTYSEGPELDASSRAPTLLKSTKRKRNERTWRKNQRKLALDQGII